METKTSPNSVYTPIQVKAPTLSGWLLRFITFLAGSRWFSKLLWGYSGMFKLRSMEINSSAVFVPLIPPTKDQHDHAQTHSCSLKGYPQKTSSSLSKNTSGFTYRSIREYHAMYAKGELTPFQVAEQILAWLDSHDPTLLAFSEVFKSSLLEEAQLSTERWQRQSPLSILDGIPIAVKDQFQLKASTTSFGTQKGLPKATKDAWCVMKCREAGALVVGKTCMSELGLDITNCNPVQTPRNPWDLKRHTGGSSGGSAAAVAAGLVPFAIGTDGGGSVRIPASFCGIWGLKPTWSRVSGFPSESLGVSVGSIGVLAGNLEDTVLGYLCLSQPCPEHYDSQLQPLVSIPRYLSSKSVKGLKLGYFEPYFNHAIPQVVDICKKALDELVHEGAEVCDIEIPNLVDIRIAHVITILSEIGHFAQRNFPVLSYLTLPTQFLLKMSTNNITLQDYFKAQQVRGKIIRHLSTLFQTVDVIVLPTTGILAPLVREDALKYGISDSPTTLDGVRFTFLANFTGNPAISCPVGWVDNVPVGFQIIGKWWDEDVLFQLARVLEKKTQRPFTPPSIHFDVLKSGETVENKRLPKTT